MKPTDYAHTIESFTPHMIHPFDQIIKGFTVATDSNNKRYLYNTKTKTYGLEVTGYDVCYDNDTSLIFFTKSVNGKKLVLVFDALKGEFVNNTHWVLNEYYEKNNSEKYDGNLASFFEADISSAKLLIFEAKEYREENSLSDLRADTIVPYHLNDRHTCLVVSNSDQKCLVRYDNKELYLASMTEEPSWYDEIIIDHSEIIRYKKDGKLYFSWEIEPKKCANTFVYGGYDSITYDNKCKDIMYCKRDDFIDIWSLVGHNFLGTVYADKLSAVFSNEHDHTLTVLLRSDVSDKHNIYKAVINRNELGKRSFECLLSQGDVDSVNILKQHTDDSMFAKSSYSVIFDVINNGSHKALCVFDKKDAFVEYPVFDEKGLDCSKLVCDYLDDTTFSLRFTPTAETIILNKQIIQNGTIIITREMKDGINRRHQYTTDHPVNHIDTTLYVIYTGKPTIFSPLDEGLCAFNCQKFSIQNRKLIHLCNNQYGIIDPTNPTVLKTDNIYSSVECNPPYYAVSQKNYDNGKTYAGVLYTFNSSKRTAIDTIVPVKYKGANVLDERISVPETYGRHGHTRYITHAVILLENGDGSKQLATHEENKDSITVMPTKFDNIIPYKNIIVATDENGTHIYDYADPYFKEAIAEFPAGITVQELSDEIAINGKNKVLCYYYLINGQYYSYYKLGGNKKLVEQAVFMQPKELHMAKWEINGTTYELSTSDCDTYQKLVAKGRYYGAKVMAKYLERLMLESGDDKGDSGFTLTKHSKNQD